MKFLRDNWRTLFVLAALALVIYLIWKTVKGVESEAAKVASWPGKIVSALNPFNWFKSSSSPALDPSVSSTVVQPFTDSYANQFFNPPQYF